MILFLKSLRSFIRETRRFQRNGAAGHRWRDSAKYFGPWRRSLTEGASPLADERPWLTFAAIEFLEQTVAPAMRVFEYGSGGSTLFFAKRAGTVISVEHDPEWARQVRDAVASKGARNIELILAEPTADPGARGKDPGDPAGYVSSISKFDGLSFRAYAGAIDAYADGWFDVVLVDGRARPSCFRHAVAKVKPGGLLLLDNAERAHYVEIHRTLDAARWRKRDLSGPGPYNRYFWRTYAWTKPGGDA